MSIQLDRRSAVPLHVQIRHQLRQLIGQRRYQDGALLPDEVSLARRLHVSRGTVRNAIERLAFEGLIERRAGIGTRVAHGGQGFSSGLAAWSSFSGEMAERGVDMRNIAIDARFAAAPAAVARALGIATGHRTLCLSRLRGAGTQPAVWFVSWLHPRLKLAVDADSSQPLYRLIEIASGVVAAVSKERISAIAADRALAKRLRVRVGAPLLSRQRTVCDRDDQPMEYNLGWYRADRFTWTIDIHRHPPATS